jgi:hypothetical protein
MNTGGGGGGGGGQEREELIVICDLSPVSWALHQIRNGSNPGYLSFDDFFKQIILFLNCFLLLRKDNIFSFIGSDARRVEVLFNSGDGEEVRGRGRVRVGEKRSRTTDEDEKKKKEKEEEEEEEEEEEGDMREKKKEEEKEGDVRVDERLRRRITQFISSDVRDGDGDGDDENDDDENDDENGFLLSVSMCKAMLLLNKHNRPNSRSRVLIFSLSDDNFSQYISVMNCIFAAQKQGIPIDVVYLSSSSSPSSSSSSSAAAATSSTGVKPPPSSSSTSSSISSSLLRQCSFLTEGHYTHLQPEHHINLLHFLIASHTADSVTRRMLSTPPSLPVTSAFSSALAADKSSSQPVLYSFTTTTTSSSSGVTLQGSCSCHGNVISEGFVCSVCLSVFCQQRATCLTCKYPLLLFYLLSLSFSLYLVPSLIYLSLSLSIDAF